MSWLKAPNGNDTRPNQRGGFRQPVDIAVQLNVAGMSLPVNATIVNVSIGGCRLRSWIVLERGTAVSFEWRAGAVPARLDGTIVSRSAAGRGPAFEYGIVFAKLPAEERETLAREITQAQRRAALERAKQKGPAAAIDPQSLNRRGAFRAHTEFAVALRLDDRPGVFEAVATDVSEGGLRILSDYPLQAGQMIGVRFRLPEDVLSVYPAQAQEETVISPFGPRRRQPPKRVPFAEMSIRSRVRSRLKDAAGKKAFGIAFIEIDAYTREEILRFIHAAQLKQLREKQAR